MNYVCGDSAAEAVIDSFSDVAEILPLEKDYPAAALKLCEKVLEQDGNKGILICGTGIGMSIAANKIDGIRAAHCSNGYDAAYSRRHNDANVICLGARTLGGVYIRELASVFLNTEYDGNSEAGKRHAARVKMISDLEHHAG